jgi:hypothetical protein
MSDRLAIYLHDHRAGSNFAINLLEGMRDRKKDQELSSFGAQILAEVARDRVGESHTDLKEASAWFAEKASRMKLTHDDALGLGTFEAGNAGAGNSWEAVAVASAAGDRGI